VDKNACEVKVVCVRDVNAWVVIMWGGVDGESCNELGSSFDL